VTASRTSETTSPRVMSATYVPELVTAMYSSSDCRAFVRLRQRPPNEHLE
jgi:hypothetical protein